MLILVDPNVRPQVWRVLLWNTGRPVTSTTKTAWWVWDAATPGAATRGIPDVDHNVFCAGHTTLSDRRVLIAGGVDWSLLPGNCTFGGTWAYVYDPDGVPLPGEGPGTWTLVPPPAGLLTSMVKPRYYPGAFLLPPDLLTPLIDKAAVMTGDTSGTTVTVEIYDDLMGKFTGMTVPYSTTPQCATAYTRTHVIPSPNPSLYRGSLFTSSPFAYSGLACGGTPVKTQRLDLPANGIGSPPNWIDGPTPVTHADRADNCSVVIVDVAGHATIVMGAGKDPTGQLPPPMNVYSTIETVVDPQLGGGWSSLPNLNHARFDAGFVLLPGRRLLALGGTRDNGAPALQPELLDLNNPTPGWKLLAPHQAPREYHSFALLLPDGRVLHGGGRRTSTAPYYHAEVFSPPNLFSGPRPVIQGAALAAQYAATFTVNMAVIPPGGVSFELIRPGSMTHSTDFDQRLVEVSATSAGGSNFTVTAPSGPDVAPPGWYMLFAVSAAGVPSVATFMRIHS